MGYFTFCFVSGLRLLVDSTIANVAPPAVSFADGTTMLQLAIDLV
jgi:hypothetical protein